MVHNKFILKYQMTPYDQQTIKQFPDVITYGRFHVTYLIHFEIDKNKIVCNSLQFYALDKCNDDCLLFRRQIIWMIVRKIKRDREIRERIAIGNDWNRSYVCIELDSINDNMLYDAYFCSFNCYNYAMVMKWTMKN